MEVSLFVLHLCCTSKAPQKGVLMRGAMPQKEKKYINAKAEDGEKDGLGETEQLL